MADRERSPGRLSRDRLLGIDRSGPLPSQTLSGEPLRPWTIPNAIGFVRLAALPVFLVLALGSDDGREAAPALIYLAVALGDYVDGLVARATGQYSRLGAMLDPVVDRLTIIAGVVVCWEFELLPRVALGALAVREVVTLIMAQAGLRRGHELEISWIGRIAVFFVMGGLFWSQVLDWALIEILFSLGIVAAWLATFQYARRGLTAVRSGAGGISTSTSA
jgi:cardiolipin synthase